MDCSIWTTTFLLPAAQVCNEEDILLEGSFIHMDIHQFIFSITTPKQLHSTLIKLSFGTTQHINTTSEKLIHKRMICPTQLNGEQQEVGGNECNRQEKEKKKTLQFVPSRSVLDFHGLQLLNCQMYWHWCQCNEEKFIYLDQIHTRSLQITVEFLMSSQKKMDVVILIWWPFYSCKL